jgi:hypothetical protein
MARRYLSVAMRAMSHIVEFTGKKRLAELSLFRPK